MDFMSLDDDLVLAGIDGYVRSSNSNYFPIYRLKQGTTVFRFVTDPWTRNEDNGWLFYREVSAFDGLRGGFPLPNGLKEFPVNDQVTIVTPEGEKRRTNGPRGQDPLLELVAPSTKFPPADGRAKGADKLAVNVIDSEGNHIILKMSGARGADLLRAFNGYRDLSDDFTVTRFPWQLTLSGAGASTTLSVKPLKNEPPVELPEPFDLRVVMDNIRAQVEEYVNSLRGDSDEQAVAADDDLTVDDFEAQVSHADDNLEQRQKYAQLTDARLKALLSKNGITVPPRSTRPALIELAVAHNV